MAEERLRKALDRDYERSDNMNSFGQFPHPNVIIVNNTPCMIVNGMPIPLEMAQQYARPVVINRPCVIVEQKAVNSCKVPGCRYNHTKHMCNACGNTDAIHFENDCPVNTAKAAFVANGY